MARLTDTQRLTRGGIIHVEIDGVLARFTKKQSRDDASALRANLGRWLALSTVVASSIRARMKDGSGPVGGLRPYADARRRGGYVVSQPYASQLGIKRWHVSSAAMHSAAGVRPGSYSVTGGMWRGLEVVGSGRHAAAMGFRGSSLSSRKGKRNVRNQIKASAILRVHDVQVLEPAPREIAAVSEALDHVWLLALSSMTGRPPHISAGPGADRSLFRRLVSTLSGPGVDHLTGGGRR